MVDLAKCFSRETRNALHMFGGWPPGETMELGAYGILEGDLFRREGNIAQSFGVGVKERPTGTKLQLDFKSAGISEDKVSAAAAADAGHTGALKASVKLHFKHRGSVLFKTKDTVYHCIEDLDSVHKAIMVKFMAGEWRGDLAFVHGVFRPAASTVIISSHDEAEMDLEATASGVKQLDLADAKAGIVVVGSKDIAFQEIAKDGRTPLICLSQVRPKNRWLAFLGLSGKTVRPLMSSLTDDGTGNGGSDSYLARLNIEVAPTQATDEGLEPEALFHVVEVDGTPTAE